MLEIISTIITTLAITTGYTFALMVLYRMAGGMQHNLPWKWDQIITGILITSPLFLGFGAAGYDVVVSGSVWIISAIITAVFKSSGHGQWFNFRFLTNFKYLERIKPERLDFIPKLFYGIDPRTTQEFEDAKHPTKVKILKDYGLKKLSRRCQVGLFVSGASVAIPLSIGLVHLGDWFLGLLTLVGFGAIKAIAYLAGWSLYPDGSTKDPSVPVELNEATEIGEAGSGIAGMFVGLIVAYFLF